MEGNATAAPAPLAPNSMLAFCTPLVLSLVPSIVYWIAVWFYSAANFVARLIDPPTTEELEKTASMRTREPSFSNLMFYVMLEQVMMTVGGAVFSAAEKPEEYFSPYLLDGHDRARQALAWLSLALRFLLGVFVVDSWSYWLHRFMHTNQWWYKNVHSWHHRYNITRLSAAMYNHPLEAFLLDVLGGGLGQIFGFMSIGEATFLFMLVQWKVVQDHGRFDFAWCPASRVVVTH